jgi:PIN domain nuclease of toxin-antitoxin system
MRLLLDTCVFLWLIGLPERLPARVQSHIEDAGNPCAVSTASLWECLIKHSRGGVVLSTGELSALDFLLWQCERHALSVLPIPAATLRPLQRLPTLHHDPFDRLLVCQAIEEGLTLVTPDAVLRRYPVGTLWDD